MSKAREILEVVSNSCKNYDNGRCEIGLYGGICPYDNDTVAREKCKSYTEGDVYRSGKWIKPSHLTHADPKYYDLARSTPPPGESQDFWQEYNLARVFNDPKVARNIALQMIRRERTYLSRTESEEIEAAQQELNLLSLDRYKTQFTFDPEKTAVYKDTLDRLYNAIDKNWPSKPQYKAFLTYWIIASGVEKYVEYPWPYWKEVNDAIDKAEEEGRQASSDITVLGYLGIGKDAIRNITKFIRSKGEELGFTVAPGTTRSRVKKERIK